MTVPLALRSKAHSAGDKQRSSPSQTERSPDCVRRTGARAHAARVGYGISFEGWPGMHDAGGDKAQPAARETGNGTAELQHGRGQSGG